MTKLKCLVCGYINDLGTEVCVECQTVLGDPTINQQSAPRPQRSTSTYGKYQY